MKFIKNITFNQVLTLIGVLTLIIFSSSEFFSFEIQTWITNHLRVFSSSIIITIIARLIGLLKSDDFANSDSFSQLFALQIILSYNYDNKFLDPGTTFFYITWFFPTIVFIARRYFKRIQRIEDMLIELKHAKKQINQDEGLQTTPISYKDDL